MLSEAPESDFFLGVLRLPAFNQSFIPMSPFRHFICVFGVSVQRPRAVFEARCVFPGPLPVWGESWEVLFSQDASRRLLVPSPVSTFQGVPAPPLQIPHQEVQVCGADSPSSAPLLEGHMAVVQHPQIKSLVF